MLTAHLCPRPVSTEGAGLTEERAPQAQRPLGERGQRPAPGSCWAWRCREASRSAGGGGGAGRGGGPCPHLLVVRVSGVSAGAQAQPPGLPQLVLCLPLVAPGSQSARGHRPRTRLAWTHRRSEDWRLCALPPLRGPRTTPEARVTAQPGRLRLTSPLLLTPHSVAARTACLTPPPPPPGLQAPKWTMIP